VWRCVPLFFSFLLVVLSSKRTVRCAGSADTSTTFWFFSPPGGFFFCSFPAFFFRGDPLLAVSGREFASWCRQKSPECDVGFDHPVTLHLLRGRGVLQGDADPLLRHHCLRVVDYVAVSLPGGLVSSLFRFPD